MGWFYTTWFASIFAVALPAIRYPYAISVYFEFYQSCFFLPRRLCCARRDIRTIGRRRLGCTCARSAERHPQGVYRIRKAAKPPTAAQQRVVEAETNRLAKLTRLRRTQAVAFRRHKGCSSLGLPIKRLSFGRSHRPFSFSGKKMGGVVLPPAGGISLRAMRGI